MVDDYLVIKADKFYTQLDLIAITGVLILSLTQYIVDQHLIGALILATLILPCLFDYVVNAKTIVMTEHQVTVSFLCFRKTYQWKDIVTKRYIKDHHSLSRNVSSNGAEFYTKQIRRPKWMSASFYAMFVHPLSFFFVSFPSTHFVRQPGSTPYPYEVDELLFREKLKTWNVDMSQISESYF